MHTSTRKRLMWVGVAAVVAVAALVPVALADKPNGTGNGKPKPVASEKTWVKVGGGASYGTFLKLDAGFASALSGAGIAVAPLVPSSDPTDTPDRGIRFPITQGKLVQTTDTSTPPKVTGVHGVIAHVGGLSLTKGSTVVRIRGLVIVANVAATDTSKLTARVNGKRTDFAALTFGGVPTTTAKTLSVASVTVKLSAPAAAALNKAFGTSLTAGTLVGTASVDARIVGQGKA